MKIIFVNNARVCSGCEDHLLDVAVWLRDNGVDPVFLVREEGILRERLDRLNIRYYPVFTGTNKLLLPLRIGRALVAEKPDIVSVNREHNIMPVYAAAALTAPFLPRRPRLAVVFHTPTGRWYPRLASFDGIVGTSRYTAESFVRANPGIAGKIQVIHYGIRLPEADPVRKLDRDRPRRYFRDRGFPVIGMVGELWKNQEELVDAASELVRAYPRMTIAFIGGYDPAPALVEKIAASGCRDNFVLTGRVDRKLIPDIFFDLDLSVSTHRNEGFGIVHIESLAALTPVVAYNSGGLVEILEKGGGALVNGGAGEFAAAVLALLGDDDRRCRLGEEGRRVVEEHFSIDAMGSKHLEFYRRLLHRDNLK
jgi:L-malate glycosyltransferase